MVTSGSDFWEVEMAKILVPAQISISGLMEAAPSSGKLWLDPEVCVDALEESEGQRKSSDTSNTQSTCC